MAFHYRLQCLACSAEIDDDGFALGCQIVHEPALLTTRYADSEFKPEGNAQDIRRYRNWLPLQSNRHGAGRTITYRSEQLNRILGLPHLWIAFNGYWPERGATLETTTFKELEAYTVLSRLPQRPDRVLVVASAGNTAAAFAHLCSQNGVPSLIVIPERGLQRMQFPQPLNPCVRVVSVGGLSDYYDAIRLAERVSQCEGFFFEGGVRNVGRRDGIGTTMLDAVETIGQLPDYYFQAIGSGTGGIAVHEAAKKLLVDGRFGQKPPRLMLGQNVPFAPMYHSWKAGRRELIEIEREVGKEQIRQIVADVLSNQRPPYTITGGVFDALEESQGDMLVATNHETRQAMGLFQECEGVDIDPAAGVALATLIDAAERGQVDRQALILLHVTGGGWGKRGLEKSLLMVEPDLCVEESEVLVKKTVEKVVQLFQ
jgi:cysteate synthase